MLQTTECISVEDAGPAPFGACNVAPNNWELVVRRSISINEIEAVITLKTNPLEENFFGMIVREADEI